jgi:hypothetical protein
VVGVGAMFTMGGGTVVLTDSLNGTVDVKGGVDGGGVDAADDEVDALDDLGELWCWNRAMGSLFCEAFDTVGTKIKWK